MNNTDSLRMFWSCRERDFVYSGPRSCDRHLLYCFLSERRYDSCRRGPDEFGEAWKCFLIELEKRGYDTRTLRISVKCRPSEVEKAREEQQNRERIDDEDRAIRSCVQGDAT